MEYIFLFLGISFLTSASRKNSAKGMIERIVNYSRYYPKRYMVTPKWIMNVFKISKRTIPRYLCFELILSIFYAALGPLNLIICGILATVDSSINIAGELVMFHICLFLIDTVLFVIIVSILKRNKPR